MHRLQRHRKHTLGNRDSCLIIVLQTDAALHLRPLPSLTIVIKRPLAPPCSIFSLLTLLAKRGARRLVNNDVATKLRGGISWNKAAELARRRSQSTLTAGKCVSGTTPPLLLLDDDVRVGWRENRRGKTRRHWADFFTSSFAWRVCVKLWNWHA